MSFWDSAHAKEDGPSNDRNLLLASKRAVDEKGSLAMDNYDIGTFSACRRASNMLERFIRDGDYSPATVQRALSGIPAAYAEVATRSQPGPGAMPQAMNPPPPPAAGLTLVEANRLSAKAEDRFFSAVAVAALQVLEEEPMSHIDISTSDASNEIVWHLERMRKNGVANILWPAARIAFESIVVLNKGLVGGDDTGRLAQIVSFVQWLEAHTGRLAVALRDGTSSDGSRVTAASRKVRDAVQHGLKALAVMKGQTREQMLDEGVIRSEDILKFDEQCFDGDYNRALENPDKHKTLQRSILTATVQWQNAE